MQDKALTCMVPTRSEMPIEVRAGQGWGWRSQEPRLALQVGEHGEGWVFLDFFFNFLGPHLRHMEVPRLGVKLELQLLAYVTATPDPSHICDLHQSSWQCQILHPLIKDRGQIHILMGTSQVLNLLSQSGNSKKDGFLAAKPNIQGVWGILEQPKFEVN